MITYPILDLILQFKLYIIIFTYFVTHYSIKTAYMLGIWKINCIIPHTGAELMGGPRHKRERDHPP